MTVIDTTRKVKTVGTGSQTAFTFTFPVLDEGDLEINVITTSTGVKVLQVITTDYTVSLNTITEGGTVTMIVAPASTEDLLIVRNVDVTQPTDIPNRGSVQESQLEDAYDRAIMITGQLQEQLDRAALQDIADTGSNFTLPSPEADKLLGWNSAADDFENVVNNAVATAADVVTTNADVVLTNADVVTTNADVVLTNADVVLTNADVVSAAASLAAIRPSMTNKSGGGHITGDVCVIDSANTDSVKNSITQGDKKIVLIATATIADNAVGTYQTGAGEIAINIKGSISIGDFVRISTTAKQAESAGATAVDGSFAQAAASGTNVLVNCVLGVPAVSSSGDIKKDSGEPQMRMLRGVVNSDATIAQGTGFTITDSGTGNHIVVHATNFNARPTVVCSVDFSAAVNRVVFDGGASGSSTIRTFNQIDGVADLQFGFFIIGEE